MDSQNEISTEYAQRRQRLHELLIALIHQQEELELMDPEEPRFDGSRSIETEEDPASWLDRNRRVLKRYQALVRSAITLDALVDAEKSISS